MKAYAIDTPGSFENLTLMDLPKPEPKKGEILVKIHVA